MIIFNQMKYKELARKIVRQKGTGLRLGKFEKHIFPNGEYQLILASNVRNVNCVVLGSVSPSSNLLDMLLHANLLKKEGARKITAIIPYFAFGRQEDNELNKSWGLKVVANIFRASDIDKIITLDLHSGKGLKF